MANKFPVQIAKREKDLESEREGRKKDQVRLSELEDENHRLKQATNPPAPSTSEKSFRWPTYNT